MVRTEPSQGLNTGSTQPENLHDKPNLRSSTFSSSSRWSKASSAAPRRGLIIDQDRKAKAGEPFVATDNNEYNALDKADCRGRRPFRRHSPSGRPSGRNAKESCQFPRSLVHGMYEGRRAAPGRGIGLPQVECCRNTTRLKTNLAEFSFCDGFRDGHALLSGVLAYRIYAVVLRGRIPS